MKKRLIAVGLFCSLQVNASLLMKPTYHPDIDYQGKILTGDYVSTLTPPEQILGFEVGQRVADPAQISQALKTWETQTDRLHLVEYARSHENRPLYAAFISSPKNLNNLEAIKTKLNQLADPRSINDGDAKKIIDELPAIAWMAYSIHGNETSGADAALAAIYHYLAEQGDDVSKMLDDMIIIIDPMMNPDGRARFAKSLEQYRGTAPNVDDQSLLHRGDWPYGRTNHYLFDLNRDFVYLTQPETKGRVALINKWRPQLMIDGHEMGSQDTFLMGPPRQPLNFNIAPSVQKWANNFAQEQAEAFDAKGWRYYNGEWFENWYPGYSNYAEYRGSMHILYEQSRMAEDGVKRPEGTIQTYKESVHHQFVSTIANLESLQKYSKEMYKDYWQDRKMLVSSKSPFADKAFVIMANDNHSRTQLLVEKLQAQDIEVKQTTEKMTLRDAKDQFGDTVEKLSVPVGSIIINNRQPEARLLSAIMEFDAKLKPETIQEERAKVLKEGGSIMYDTSAWNFTMMYGLEAYEVSEEIDNKVKDYTPVSFSSNSVDTNAIAWLVDGADDKSVTFAARLMELGVQVRVIKKASTLSEQTFNRGTVIITTTDNPAQTNLAQTVADMANELSLPLASITSGFGAGDLPDWGGENFVLLQKPQIAIASQAGTSSGDVGSTWWSIDSNLGIRHSHLDSSAFGYSDLRRYNVIILPNRYRLDNGAAGALKEWVRQGGTLITHDNSSALVSKLEGFTDVKVLADIFADAEKFDTALQRRLLAREDYAVTDSLSSSTLSTDVSYPWDETPKALSEKELEKRDKWQSLFMPAGAMVAGTVDQSHWLTFGTNPILPLMYEDQTILVAPESAESVIDVGVYQDDANAEYKDALGWYSIPNGQSLKVRMSGLVWPEAQQRIANSSFLTRESIGKGQVIQFSGQPNFRGATRGTNRLLLNAIVYGPGFGSRPKIDL
ncbi:M14 family metallopeptidase [Glaciecola sp. 1036]|uniref:M14 family metallopeptidase n=1 Tax=Alteromonadaceae TaxID=72275 RepID=UPI003CFCF918